MFTHYLHNIYRVSIQYLHSIYTLYKQCLHIIYSIYTLPTTVSTSTVSTVSTGHFHHYHYQSTMLPPAGAHLIGEWFPEPSSTNIITDHDGDHWDCGARAGKELTCTFNYHLIFDSSAVLWMNTNQHRKLIFKNM